MSPTYRLRSGCTEVAGASAKHDVVQKLWRGYDPMQTVVLEDRPLDAQGWNSDHVYLGRAISETRARLVVEIGVWKGGSVMTMGRALQTFGLDGVVIAVDTWRGSSEHWLANQGDWGLDIADDLGFDRGSPRLYEKFIANIRAAGLQDYVVPLPLDSINAAQVLKRMGFSFDVIHLDGGHDYDSVTADLRLWWPLLVSGGILICDDYYPDNDFWPDVRRAVDEIAAAETLAGFENQDGKAMLRKP